MFGRNVTLTVARSHVRPAIAAVVELLATQWLEPGGVISQQGPFDDAVELLGAHLRGRDTKTVLTVR
jgi:threonine dehydrogenase-like Zn-dependent dehydrogenase